MKQSHGHIEFIGGFEFFDRDGQLYRAPLSDAIMPDGFRSGRWECPMHMSADPLTRYRAAMLLQL